MGRSREFAEVALAVAAGLRHRGPDRQEVRAFPDAGLVHARLKIIDLSPSGDQPMANEDGTVWTVFNGEIYNHRQVRTDLERKGHAFRGRSDTEILPHLWEEQGPECVQSLRGIFAFAIYDSKRGRMFLARDRFGTKPLFYAGRPSALLFASELNALRRFPGVGSEPDPQAISDYAAIFSIPPPGTFFRGIRSLSPGEHLLATWDGDQIRCETRRYHQWAIRIDQGETLESAGERADELIDAAVRSQLESDVPIGCLLSGGLDSSLVSSAARRHSAALKTYNVKFSPQAWDETWAAVAVARHIGSEHSTLSMDHVPGTWGRVVGLLRHMGQPYADTSLLAANAVCQLMRRHVTVALGGDGGDEPFGGYDLFWQLERIVRLQALPLFAWHLGSVLASALAHLGPAPTSLGRHLRDFAGADDTSVMQGVFSWLREEEHRQLCLPLEAAPPRELFGATWRHDMPRGAPRAERLSAHATEINTRLRLASDFLPKVDMASMREGLEVRVPMLDEDLFAFGLTLPHRLKVKGKDTKRVLRRVAQRRLPPAVAAKRKHGFGIPVHQWVDAEFRGELRCALLSPPCRLPEFLRASVYRPWVEAFCDKRSVPGVSVQGLYQRVIMLLSLHLALEAPGT